MAAPKTTKKKPGPKKKPTGTKHTKPDREDGPDRTDPSVGTQFKPGQQAWLARSSYGRKPQYAPEELEKACLEYFQWVEDNPILEEKVFHTAGIITRADVAHIRAMTIGGLTLFLDISEDTWANYRKKPDYVGICERVDKAIRKQKIEGSAADLLNPSIIARELGLVDKQERKTDTTHRMDDKEQDAVFELAKELAKKVK